MLSPESIQEMTPQTLGKTGHTGNDFVDHGKNSSQNNAQFRSHTGNDSTDPDKKTGHGITLSSGAIQSTDPGKNSSQNNAQFRSYKGYDSADRGKVLSVFT